MGQLLRTDSAHTDFMTLVALLDKELAERDEDKNAFYAQFNGISILSHCVVYYKDQIPVACGALKPFDDNSMEIKRMYVAMDFKGKGIGSLLYLQYWKNGPKNSDTRPAC